MEFQPNSTQGSSICTYITILADNALEDSENFTLYLTSNNSGIIIPSYAQSVQVQILEGLYERKIFEMCYVTGINEIFKIKIHVGIYDKTEMSLQ